jgi:hypothetical protein
MADLSPLYAVIDTARAPEIYPGLMHYAPDAQCLYGGTLAPDIRAAAPYLVAMAEPSSVLHWVRNAGLGRAWGIALRSRAPAERVRLHLKTLLRTRLTNGDLGLFRFYDPCVLPFYLSACSEADRAAFFGPIEVFYVEATEFGPARSFHNATPPDLNARHLSFGMSGVPMPQVILDAFAPLGISARIRELTEWASRTMPYWTDLPAWSDPVSAVELNRRVRLAVSRGWRYGLRSGDAFIRFFYRMVVLSPNFDQQPTIQAVLADPVMSGDEKNRELRSGKYFMIWADAATYPQDWTERPGEQ